MKKIKARVIRGMSPEERKELLKEVYAELMTERTANHRAKPVYTLRALRKNVARIKTIIREEEEKNEFKGISRKVA